MGKPKGKVEIVVGFQEETFDSQQAGMLADQHQAAGDIATGCSSQHTLEELDEVVIELHREELEYCGRVQVEAGLDYNFVDFADVPIAVQMSLL